MITGVCIYGVKRPTTAMLDLVGSLASCLGSAQKSVTLTRNGGDSRKRLRINVGQVSKGINLPFDDYSIRLAEIEGDEDVLKNLGLYVSYVTSKTYSTLIAYSDRVSVAEFLSNGNRDRLFVAAQGSYGFATAWGQQASFWAYAAGFQDFVALKGDLTAKTPQGKWGVEFRSSPKSVTESSFRDIFEVNLISRRHISREISPGCSVQEWLNQNPCFGRLEEIANDWFRWIIPRDHIRKIKDQFLSSGILEEEFVSNLDGQN